MKFKKLIAAMAIGLGAVASSPAFAQGTGPVKIGFITDMSGLYADIDGPAGAEMVKWAAQDFGGKVLGRPIEVLTADHQNKAISEISCRSHAKCSSTKRRRHGGDFGLG